MLSDCRYTRRRKFCILFVGMGVLLGACAERADDPSSDRPHSEMERSCDAPGVREVVEDLGRHLELVPLLAPDSVLVEAIRQEYAPLVTRDLLTMWIEDPAHAPGREGSSPWPDRIEIDSVEPVGAGLCRVEGDVVYITSVELTQGGAASRERVVLRVTRDDRWRISAYEVVASPSTDSTSVTEEAVDGL